MLFGALSEAGYVNEFVYNYGAWTEDLARELWRRRANSGGDAEYFRYPMLRRVAEMADWTRKRDGTALGLAFVDYSNTLMGGVAEVSLDRPSGRIFLTRDADLATSAGREGFTVIVPTPCCCCAALR